MEDIFRLNCLMRSVTAPGGRWLWVPEEETHDSREGQVWGPACMPGVWVAYVSQGKRRTKNSGCRLSLAHQSLQSLPREPTRVSVCCVLPCYWLSFSHVSLFLFFYFSIWQLVTHVNRVGTCFSFRQMWWPFHWWTVLSLHKLAKLFPVGPLQVQDQPSAVLQVQIWIINDAEAEEQFHTPRMFTSLFVIRRGREGGRKTPKLSRKLFPHWCLFFCSCCVIMLLTFHLTEDNLKLISWHVKR